MKPLHIIAFILVIIGGLNWLVYGIWGVDVGQLFGGMTAGVSRTIYIIVGLAAIVEICMHKKCCSCCSSKAPMM